jgi:molybdenum cofactor biosynthesis protein B
MSKADRPFTPLNVAILTVSDTRTPETDTSGDTIADKLKAAGHRIAARLILKDDTDRLRAQVKNWIDDPAVDAVITTGGTGLTQRDVTPEALAPLITKPIPGFGELFRHLSYAEIGSSTVESRAFAGICGGTILFCLPGSTGACRLGMDKIILEQLDSRYKPCNLVALLPRIKHEHAPH